MMLMKRRAWLFEAVKYLLTLGAMLTLSSSASAQSATWSSVAGTIWQRASATAAVSSGVLYAVGNTSSGSTVESFAPGTNTWTQKASQGPLLADVNGTLYAASGTDQVSLYKFNPSSNSWTFVSTSPSGKGGYQMVAVGTELFFITRFGRPVQSAPFTIGLNVYDTITGTWTTEVGQFQGADEQQEMGVAVVGGKLYFVGGKPYAFNQATPRVVVYDPANASWTAKADMPVSVARPGATALNGKLYVIGGYSGVGTVTPKASTQVYDPSTNTWTQLADMPTPRYGLGVAALGNDIYAIDGVNGPDSTFAVRAVEKLSVSVTVAYYRIKNRWQNTYMHTENLTGFVQVGPICDTCLSAMWSIEDSGQGYVRLKNRWTGKYIHIENLTGKLQYGDIQPQWDSAKWFLDNFNGYKRIRNLWQNKFAHIENLTGYAQYGDVYDTWESAQWTFVPVP
ncbi:MAG TPA: kelch repeat-containing protein [Polyangiaceae bacterium]|nr:kelch repeat-containing protein [Polyangiaceae bacterium]